tara:strand:- start:356 stop:679 length:324 start_codon:yes stop_codon:yes gene_type:complete
MSGKKDIDYDKILSLSREMDREVKQFLIVNHTSEEKTARMEELTLKYDYLKTNLKPVFNMIMDGNMDMEKLEFIVSMARDVKNNRISEHSASVEVGKKIFSDVIDNN